jgi:hypothetical protein
MVSNTKVEKRAAPKTVAGYKGWVAFWFSDSRFTVEDLGSLGSL